MMSERNWARGVLLLESLFVLVGGIAIAAVPEEACARMASLRGLAESTYGCPSYSGAAPVFEVYTFSLGKHQALIALVFAYLALFGTNRAVINVGLVYWPVAAILDAVPVYTWLWSAGLIASPFPRLLILAAVFALLGATALRVNNRHPEWAAA